MELKLKLLVDIVFVILATILSIALYVLQDQIYPDLQMLKLIISVVVSFSSAYFIGAIIKKIMQIKNVK